MKARAGATGRLAGAVAACELLLAGCALALAGCGLGAGPAPTAWSSPSRREFGTPVPAPAAPKIVGQETVMSLLERNYQVTTRYGGRFVQSIDGPRGRQRRRPAGRLVLLRQRRRGAEGRGRHERHRRRSHLVGPPRLEPDRGRARPSSARSRSRSSTASAASACRCGSNAHSVEPPCRDDRSTPARARRARRRSPRPAPAEATETLRVARRRGPQVSRRDPDRARSCRGRAPAASTRASADAGNRLHLLDAGRPGRAHARRRQPG